MLIARRRTLRWRSPYSPLNATLTLCEYEYLKLAMYSPKKLYARIIRTLYRRYQWLTQAYENRWRIAVFTTFAEIYEALRIAPQWRMYLRR